MNLSILYRGPLSSCNYGCEYCPFAKRSETATQLATDRQALERFVNWIGSRHSDQIGILFTPWGEALIHPWYQEALARLTHYPQVVKAAIQTNLSCRLDWVEHCNLTKLGLWVTFHPTEISRERFVARCRELDQQGVRFSVGIVGLKAHLSEAQALRQELPSHIYLWVNAYKRQPNYYTQEEIELLTSLDPLFPVNNQVYDSLGKPCRTGHSVISVDGEGTVRRCHFIQEPIGNIYHPEFEQCLQERPCTNAVCRCHIGYIHRPDLHQDQVYGSRLLERIPIHLSKLGSGIV